ncbi:hypothetical protein FSHL1_002861 [Fusarium sambucinum]
MSAIPGADEASSIIGDISSRVEGASSIIEDVSSIIEDETTSLLSSRQFRTTKEIPDSTEQSRIPLTAIFTPSQDCTKDDTFNKWGAPGRVEYGMDYGASKESCYPSGYSEYQYLSDDVYYSPGVCPHSYVYASTWLAVSNNGPVTTFAKCCPRFIGSYVTSEWSCCSVQSSPDTITIGESTFTPLSAIYYANPIFVAWQESDISRFSPQSEARAALQRAGVTLPPELSTATITTDESSRSTSGTQPTQTEGEDPESGGGGLSSGAVAGIVVVAVLAGVLVVVAIWWFMKRYKVTRKDTNVGESGQSWVQQIYQVPDTTKTPDEVVETQRTGLQG